MNLLSLSWSVLTLVRILSQCSFWSYELSKRVIIDREKSDKPEWMSVLLCGGIAGVVTWASVFPLGEHFSSSPQMCDTNVREDVIKTRVQTQKMPNHVSIAPTSEHTSLLGAPERRLGAVQIAREAYRNEGLAVFFRGLGICSARAFIVNAVQWAMYEWVMHMLVVPTNIHHDTKRTQSI